MPEAAVNKDGESGAAEDKVRAAWKRLVPPPACNAGGAQDPGELQLGGLVAPGANCCHDSAAFCLRENVGHGQTLAFSSAVVTCLKLAFMDGCWFMVYSRSTELIFLWHVLQRNEQAKEVQHLNAGISRGQLAGAGSCLCSYFVANVACKTSKSLSLLAGSK